MTNLNQNPRYADQKVGFEIEVSSVQLPRGKYDNKTELARIKNNGKTFITLVTDGNNGSNNPYIEFVSAPLQSQEGIKKFFDVVKVIVSSVTKNTKTLSQLLKLSALSNLEVEYPDGDNANLPLEISSAVNINPNSIHINLDVPFNKLKNFANSSLYARETTDDIKSASFKHAYNLAEKKLRLYPDGLKSLFALFLYQNIAYVKYSLPKSTVELPWDFNYKNYVEKVEYDEKGRAISDVAKLKFDVLFKVSKADIIRRILSGEACESLIEMDYGELKNTLNSIISIHRTVSGKYSAESFCQVLIDNAKSRKYNRNTYFYDEPRISGLLLPKKTSAQNVPPEYYIVAEIRKDTKFNEQLKEIFNKACRADFKTKTDDFIKDFCSFVKELTK